MLEIFDFTVSYVPVVGILPHCIIVSIASAEGLINFVLDIYNSFQNNILPNTTETVYLSLPHIYMEWYKRKWPTHPLSSINHKELFIQAIKSIQWVKSAGKLWYELLKPIFITVKNIRSSSDHSVFSWVYNIYKSSLSVETDDTLLATHSRISFERLIYECDTLFDHTLLEGPKIKLLNINIIQSEYGISIDQIDHIIKNIIH